LRFGQRLAVGQTRKFTRSIRLLRTDIVEQQEPPTIRTLAERYVEDLQRELPKVRKKNINSVT